MRARKIPGILFCFATLALAQNARAATVLIEADAGAPHVVRAGETIKLRLTENPSTGYIWNVEFDPPAAAAVVTSHWTASSGLIGAPGTRDFSIAIQRRGDLVIRAKNWRPWEGDASVTKRLEFRVEAR